MFQSPTNLTPDINQPSTSVAAIPENFLKALSPESNVTGVPSLFKRHLFWPGTPKKSSKKRKSAKMPSVVLSKKRQELQGKKIAEKKKKRENRKEKF